MSTQNDERAELIRWHTAMANEPKRNEAKRQKHRATAVLLAADKAGGEPQAQAGEPEVVAYGAITDYGIYEVSRTKICLGNDELITLQSHREAMAKSERGYDIACSVIRDLREALANKDAALQACVEAGAMVGKYGAIEPVCAFNHKEWRSDLGALKDAITQAQEALK